jgi:hypothetical protein
VDKETEHCFWLQLNGGLLQLHGVDERGMPVTACLGEASRALGALAQYLARLELSRMLIQLPRGH